LVEATTLLCAAELLVAATVAVVDEELPLVVGVVVIRLVPVTDTRVSVAVTEPLATELVLVIVVLDEVVALPPEGPVNAAMISVANTGILQHSCPAIVWAVAWSAALQLATTQAPIAWT
jgi:hypothetical protein